MSQTTILILGAGVMQLPAIRWAKRQGWKVYVADGNKNAVGLELADHFVPVDLTDVDGMIRAAGEIRRNGGLDGVFTAGTDFSYTVAKVAEAHSLPGIPPEVALAASNKAVMRRRFLERGVPTPSFEILEESSDPQAALETLSLPLVVKPVDNMGSRGIRRIDTMEDFLEAVRTARTFSRSKTVIVEEYIPGEEYSIDALVYNGEVRFTGIADRHIFFPPYFVEMGHTIPSRAEGEKLELIKEAFIDGVRALGIDNGAAKGDVKWDGRRGVIGEIAARLSGGYMSGWTYPFCSGVELTGAALQLAVGLEPAGLMPTKEWVSAERAFISIPGVVQAVEGAEDARRRAHIREVFVRVGPGDAIDFPTNNVEKGGNCISAAASRDTAIEAAEAACRNIFVRLVPGNPKTYEFLFEKKEEWIPEAFRLEAPENLRALEEMESYRSSDTPANPAGQRKVAILPLPALKEETGADWHGEKLPEAMARVEKLSKASLVKSPEDADIVIGSLFWRAFLRGGIQAGVWVIDLLAFGELEKLWE